MRDKYLCVRCSDPATEVHHKQRVLPSNIDKIETHGADNLESLCRECHCREHDEDRINTSSILEGYYFDKDGNLHKT